MGSPAELLITELRSKLDGQVQTLESARTRAGIAVSAAGVIAGLFATHLTPPIGWSGRVALLVFGVGTLPAVWIFWPHRMKVNPEANEWIAWAKVHEAFVRGNVGHPDASPLASGDLGSAELAAVMLPNMQRWFMENQGMLRWIHICVGACFLAVLLQAACWIAAIWS
jgi:hypothetical protein